MEECTTTITINTLTAIITQPVREQTTEEEQAQQAHQPIPKTPATEPPVRAITTQPTPEQPIPALIIQAAIPAADGGTVQGHQTQDRVILAEGVRVHQAVAQTPVQEGANNKIFPR